MSKKRILVFVLQCHQVTNVGDCKQSLYYRVVTSSDFYKSE